MTVTETRCGMRWRLYLALNLAQSSLSAKRTHKRTYEPTLVTVFSNLQSCLIHWYRQRFLIIRCQTEFNIWVIDIRLLYFCTASKHFVCLALFGTKGSKTHSARTLPRARCWCKCGRVVSGPTAVWQILENLKRRELCGISDHVLLASLGFVSLTVGTWGAADMLPSGSGPLAGGGVGSMCRWSAQLPSPEKLNSTLCKFRDFLYRSLRWVKPVPHHSCEVSGVRVGPGRDVYQMLLFPLEQHRTKALDLLARPLPLWARAVPAPHMGCPGEKRAHVCAHPVGRCGRVGRAAGSCFLPPQGLPHPTPAEHPGRPTCRRPCSE